MSFTVITCTDKKFGWFEDENGKTPIECDSCGDGSDGEVYMPIELAHLFAAAPDLLEACKEALKNLNVDRSRVVAPMLEEAIAKADGIS